MHSLLCLTRRRHQQFDQIGTKRNMADHSNEHDSAQQDVDTGFTNIDTAQTGANQECTLVYSATAGDSTTNETAVTWCLFCHRRGHQAVNCSRGEFVVEKIDRWTLLSAPRVTPPCDQPIAVTQLINTIASRRAQTADYRSYVSDRDALFLRILQRVEDGDALFISERWIPLMSAFNITVDIFATLVFDEPCKLVHALSSSCPKPPRDILDFLYQASSEIGVSRFADKAEGIKRPLETVRSRCTTALQTLVVMFRAVLDGLYEKWNARTLTRFFASS